MLRVVENNSAISAKRYYTDGVSRGDYYVGDAPNPSFWAGMGSEHLGLRGKVERDAFDNLCDNLHPDGSRQLTSRTKANRRVGYDLNFNCPKSVSLLYALTEDAALVTAFLEAVTETMRLIEGEAGTRVRLGGVSRDRVTGNLLWATFLHTTTRPVDGVPDPHLHVHAFAFNATFDAEENRWKAAQFGDIKRYAPYFEACFHASLASKVASLGYGVERRGRFWEIAGVSEGLVDKFSRRTAEIDRFAERHGITDPRRKDALGARTRKGKSEAKPWAKVEADWRARLTPDEWEGLSNAKGGRPSSNACTTREAVEFGLRTAFERSSVADERKVIEQTLRYGVGTVKADDAKRELGKLNLVRRVTNGRTWLSAKGMLEDEARMVSLAKEGRGACRAMNGGGVELDAALSEKVRRSVSDLLQSRDRVVLFRPEGNARLAKDAARAAIEACGHRIVPLDGRGSEDRATKVLEALGKFSERRAGKDSGRVLWVNNAEHFGAGTLAEMFGAAKANDGRVVLCGRVKQNGPVELRGSLATLERLGGVTSGVRDRRERNEQETEAALQAIRDGKAKSALKRLENLGNVREAAAAELPKAVAQEFAKATRQKKSARIRAKGKSENEKAAFTQAVRSELTLKRLLGRSRKMERLERVGLSEEQRKQSKNYERGQVVTFHKSVKGFKAGHRYKVMGTDPFGNVLAREIRVSRRIKFDKKLWFEALPLSKSEHFDVYKRDHIEVAKGDLIRITAGGRTLNERFGMEKLLSNRKQAIRRENLKLFGMKAADRRYRVRKDSTYRVSGFTLRGDIKLDNGWVLPRRFGHIEHGYVEDERSEKQSVQRLLVVAGEKTGQDFAEESSAKGMKSVVVFTDDKERLVREAAQASSERAARTSDEQEKAREHERARAAERQRTRERERERQR